MIPARPRRRDRASAAAIAASALVLVAMISGCGGTPETTGETAAGVPPSASPIRSLPGREALIWAVGDGDAGEQGRSVVHLIAASDPDRVLYLGDVYPEGTAAQFANNFDPAYGRLASRVAPTVGNHEAWEVASGYDPYWNDVEGAALPPFYAFDAAGWQILSLNSEIDHAPGSRQIRWLEKATRAPGTCRIAFWHRPRFSAGTVHPGDEDVASFWNVLAGRAVAVVNGHAHSMQRFAPADGLTQFIAGTGGRDLHPLRPEPPPELAFGEDREYGALRLELAPGGAAYAFVAADGRVLDAGHLRCVDLTRQPGGA